MPLAFLIETVPQGNQIIEKVSLYKLLQIINGEATTGVEYHHFTAPEQ